MRTVQKLLGQYRAAQVGVGWNKKEPGVDKKDSCSRTIHNKKFFQKRIIYKDHMKEALPFEFIYLFWYMRSIK